MRTRRAAILAAASVGSLLLVGCGGGLASSSGTTTAPPTTTMTSPPSPTATAPMPTATAPMPTATAPTTPPPTQPASGSGAFGYVTAGPTCPVERLDHPCPPHPVSTVIDARTAGGVTIASARSDDQGRYALDLAPGSYFLVVAGSTAWPRCPTVPVTVRSGSSARTDISCDTGIR